MTYAKAASRAIEYSLLDALYPLRALAWIAGRVVSCHASRGNDIMHSKVISLACCAAIFMAIVLMPVFWQWSYRARLEHVVPIGSTRDDYLKALLDNRLGAGNPRPGSTFWRPINFHGIVYTISAVPNWDSSQHLTEYHLFSAFSLWGYRIISPHRIYLL